MTTASRTVAVLSLLLLWSACNALSAQGATAAVSAPDAVAEAPSSFRVSGSAEDPSYLYVAVIAAGASCAPNYPRQKAATNDDRALFAGRHLAANYSEQYTFTPPASGGYVVCAFLTNTSYEDDSDPRNLRVTATGSFAARDPQAMLTLAASGEMQQDRPLTIRASGSSDATRSLRIFVQYGSTCPATSPPGRSTTTDAAGLDPSVTGAFDLSFSLTPDSTDSYAVCGYLVRPGTSVRPTELTVAAATTFFKTAPPAPRALTSVALKTTREIGYSSARPGATLIDLRSSPYAGDLVLTVRRGARVLQRTTFTVQDDPRVKFHGVGPAAPEQPGRFSAVHTWACDGGGRTTYEVTGKDAYGHRLTRRTTISLPSCKSIVRAERERLREAADAERYFAARDRRFRKACTAKGGRVRTINGQRRCLEGPVIVGILIIISRR